METLNEGAEKDEMKYQFQQAVSKVEAWKAHILRSINQDQARLDVLQRLDQHTAIIVLDWAMKFLPQKFREAQSDWFAKRGISWHLAVAMRRVDDTIQMLTFTHIFEKCNQVSETVLAIIDDVFHQLKSSVPEITTVHLRQDNAGCYHSTAVVLSVKQIANKHNVNLASMDFSDPQGGKGSCDRKAATIKSKMKIFLNEGHDIETAAQMVEAIESKGGVSGVRVRLCGQQITELPKLQVKWDGISFLNNMAFEKNGIRVRRAYDVGRGKLKPWNDFEIPENYYPPTLDDPRDISSQASKVSFTPVTVRRRKSDDKQEIPNDSEEQCSDNEETSLFFCPEESCTKSFQRQSALQSHLDCGKHKYALERETLYDKAALIYASKLEQGDTCDIPHLTTNDQPVRAVNQPNLKMGWALKSNKEHKRLSEKQKKYLIKIYDVGEKTGQKADPVAVSNTMRKSRLPSGEPMFSIEEYLTAQQIASFFSRHTTKRKKQAIEEAQKDEREIITEKLVQDLQKEVHDKLALAHPLIYDKYNLCDCVANNKLERLSILLLQDICSYFQLDISSVKVKRKKPYIDIIKGFVRECSCNSS